MSGVLKAPLAIAFDLDGTLVDSRLDIAAACNHALARAGRDVLDPGVIANYVGDGARTLVARAFRVRANTGVDANLDAWTADLVSYYASHPVDHTTWMPGAVWVLDTLKGLPMAVVTNKPREVAVRVLDALGASHRFSHVYAGGDGPLKPSGNAILSAAKALSVQVEDLWVIGDSDQDIFAAHAAGAAAVAICGGYADEARLRSALPDAILASLTELPAVVHRANS